MYAKTYCRALYNSTNDLKGRKSVSRLLAAKPEQPYRTILESLLNAPWSDRTLMQALLRFLIPMTRGYRKYWVIKTVQIPRYRNNSLGVVHCYSNDLSKYIDCQLAITLSMSTTKITVPVAYQLYVPSPSNNPADTIEKLSYDGNPFINEIENVFNQIEWLKGIEDTDYIICNEPRLCSNIEFINKASESQLLYFLAIKENTLVTEKNKVSTRLKITNQIMSG
ncbi:transposase [Methylomonas montana]|uniref:transposase n=1 Tax=Methylomonas montana TaxID=3058963 RepID=UPI002658F921|nr:transposase [Methylomonas montana]WKJ92617.1 transposase [Methylomonas montana]